MAAGMKMSDDHACCRAKMAGTDEHCSNSSHEAAAGMEAMPATVDESQTPAPAGSQSLAPPAETCSHCIIHKGLPTAPVNPRESAQNRPDANRLALQEAKRPEPLAVRFVSAIAPTQGAPPGPPARKHLLLSVFLI
jgi:hypothetical protein